ncbi:MAG: hypothetical protein OXJ52_01230 [Oligoflexia bacterium]|nr:hypothetical protein [Oligoflexia bacterium]
MKNFILGLLVVVLIKPCVAQEMSEAFASRALDVNQAYSSLNVGFNDISEVFAKQQVQIKIEPISQDKAYLLAEQALIVGQSSWGVEKAGFEKAVYSLPVQIKTVPISEEQAQLFLNSINTAQRALGIDQAYFDSMPHVAMFGPGNGGGGTIYKAGITGFQGYLNGQFKNSINDAVKLQGIKINPYSSELTYWKTTANNNEIEKFLSFVYGAGSPASEEMMIYAEKIAKNQYGNNRNWNFTKKALPAQLVDDNILIHYGTNTAEFIKQAIGENQDNFFSEFNQTTDHFQNRIVSVVGPGNGGGGTYIK